MASPSTRSRRSSIGRSGQHGQIVVLFALCLVAIVAMSALLIDGGLAWSNRRQAQAAADTAALAAAKAVVDGGDPTSAAQAIAALNGFPSTVTDCSGAAVPGVTVNRPPASGPHQGDTDYVEVITNRPMRTTFAGALGMSCWMVSARAVATIAKKSVASCSFCSLNASDKNHTLVLKNGATLRVDGDIYTNSSNGGSTPGKCGKLEKWFVCGDAFDIFGAGGYISARTISVVGGWETHDNNPTYADYLAPGCVDTYDPPSQPKPPASNVCIHMPVIADPLNDPANPANRIDPPDPATMTVPTAASCPSGTLFPSGTATNPVTLSITTSATLCPGIYYGGIRITGSASVTLLGGVYYIAGGGFTVLNSASVDGSAGVMIYNSSGTIAEVDTNPGVDLVPPKDKNKKDPKLSPGLTSSANPSTVGQTVTYTFQIQRDKNNSPTPTGLMTFFDGQDPIASCANLPVQPAGTGSVKATCSQTYSTFGTRSITAVYYGDSFYNAIGGALTQTVNQPAGSKIAPITITTSGRVTLYGPTSGPYSGLTIFQDRSSNLTITLSPGPNSAPACGPNWLTQDVPDVPGVDPPPPCGAIGGLRGTLYAPHPDALVYITASGLANLQVIAGKIQIDSNADTRFAFTPQYFANGSIHLAE